MDTVEQRWRAGEYVHYTPHSPPDSDPEDVEATLVPSHNTSAEDTLTDDAYEKEEVFKPIIEETNEIDNDTQTDGNIIATNVVNDNSINTINEKVSNEDNASVQHSVERTVENIHDEIKHDTEVKEKSFERVEESYSLEMKLALGLDEK